jgi:hypothetical protein
MRTLILALAFTVTSLGAIETQAELKARTKVEFSNYNSARFYAKRNIRNAKVAIHRAKRVVRYWSPYRADLAEAIRHYQYAIDLYYWGDFYESSQNSEYAGRVAEYILFQGYDNGFCSGNDLYSYYNGNGGWFWGNNNGWGFGFGYNSNNNGWNNNNNNGWNNNNGGWNNNNNGNWGDDYDLYKKGKPRKDGSSEFGLNKNNPSDQNNGKPRFSGSQQQQKPSFEKPSMDAGRPRMSAPNETNQKPSTPQINNAQREEMKSAFEKLKVDKPNTEKMKMKSMSDDEVLKSATDKDIE